jgi:hypothetical protein
MACASPISRRRRSAQFSAFARRIGVLAALCAIVDVLPAAAQVLGQAADDSISLWRVAAALLFCVLLAIGGAFALKLRAGTAFVLPSRTNRRLRVVESLRLSPQSTLCIVDCDGGELLMVTTSAGAALIDRLPARDSRPMRRSDGIS